MVNLCMDDVAFRLQKMGGVSVYWEEIIKRAAVDDEVKLTLLSAQKPIDNVAYSNIESLFNEVQNERFSSLPLQRLFPAQVAADERMIFHSSYFRTTNSKNVRTVLTVYDCIDQVCARGLVSKYNDWLKRRCIAGSDVIICISHNTKADLIRFYPETASKPVFVQHIAASEEYRRLDNHDLSNEFSDVKDKRFVLFVGGRSSYKNFDFAVRAIEAVPEYTLVLVGGSKLNQKEEALVSCLNGRFVHYQGVSNENLNLLYNNAHALLYPSSYEGFGIPVLEAMRAGCPAIALNASSIPEVMGDSGLMLPQLDEGACVKALRDLERNDRRNEVIAAQNEKQAEFSWDKTYMGHKAIYEGLSEASC